MLHIQLTSPVYELSSVGPEHVTAGLDGYPAHDWYAPSGSPVISPADGVITKLSGHDPKLGPLAPHGPFGWSVYVRSLSATYYLTHLATRGVAQGSRVRRGQVLGTVAPWHLHGLPDHVHMGVHVG